MNRKGFTLVELLAVILILSGISMIAVFGISASLERNKERECEMEKEIIVNAAKVYFSLNDNTQVSVEILKNGDYMSKNSNITRYDNSTYVKIEDHDYILVGDCK